MQVVFRSNLNKMLTKLVFITALSIQLSLSYKPSPIEDNCTCTGQCEACVWRSIQCFVAPCPPDSYQCQTFENCPKESFCRLPKKTGPCKALLHRWYFDKVDKICKQFIYGGCEGNKNNFMTKTDCETACITG